MELLGIIAVNDWLLVICLLVLAFYFFSTWNANYWSNQGVPGPKLKPFYLGYGDMMQEGLSMDEKYQQLYGDTVGVFEGNVPALQTVDDDLLREILVKQFNCFANRREFAFMDGTILKGNLSAIKHEEWKSARDLLSPVFSSGKLKKMVKHVNDCAKWSVKQLENTPPEGKEYNLKEVFSEATINMIATVAFGLDLEDSDSIKEFSEMGRRFSEQFSTGFDLKMLLFMFLMPNVGLFLKKHTGLEVMDEKPLRFFAEAVETAMAACKKGDTSRTDFIQAMINAHNETVDEVTIEESQTLGGSIGGSKSRKGMDKAEILANGVLFFVAGFDTVASTLAVLFHQLALNPEHQEKVHQEAAELFDRKNELDFDDLKQLQYLDWCISEALRLYPAAARIDREASYDIEVNGIKIKKGSIINIPVTVIHYDERRWPNPKVFRPERFSDEEKKGRSPFSWMPFGYGPRHCIGMRLALMEAKIVAAYMLHNYRFEPCSKTMIPYAPDKFGQIKGDGLDMKIFPRNA